MDRFERCKNDEQPSGSPNRIFNSTLFNNEDLGKVLFNINSLRIRDSPRPTKMNSPVPKFLQPRRTDIYNLQSNESKSVLETIPEQVMYGNSKSWLDKIGSNSSLLVENHRHIRSQISSVSEQLRHENEMEGMDYSAAGDYEVTFPMTDENYSLDNENTCELHSISSDSSLSSINANLNETIQTVECKLSTSNGEVMNVKIIHSIAEPTNHCQPHKSINRNLTNYDSVADLNVEETALPEFKEKRMTSGADIMERMYNLQPNSLHSKRDPIHSSATEPNLPTRKTSSAKSHETTVIKPSVPSGTQFSLVAPRSHSLGERSTETPTTPPIFVHGTPPSIISSESQNNKRQARSKSYETMCCGLRKVKKQSKEIFTSELPSPESEEIIEAMELLHTRSQSDTEKISSKQPSEMLLNSSVDSVVENLSEIDVSRSPESISVVSIKAEEKIDDLFVQDRCFCHPLDNATNNFVTENNTEDNAMENLEKKTKEEYKIPTQKDVAIQDQESAMLNPQISSKPMSYQELFYKGIDQYSQFPSHHESIQSVDEFTSSIRPKHRIPSLSIHQETEKNQQQVPQQTTFLHPIKPVAYDEEKLNEFTQQNLLNSYNCNNPPLIYTDNTPPMICAAHPDTIRVHPTRNSEPTISGAKKIQASSFTRYSTNDATSFTIHSSNQPQCMYNNQQNHLFATPQRYKCYTLYPLQPSRYTYCYQLLNLSAGAQTDGRLDEDISNETTENSNADGNGNGDDVSDEETEESTENEETLRAPNENNEVPSEVFEGNSAELTKTASGSKEGSIISKIKSGQSTPMQSRSTSPMLAEQYILTPSGPSTPIRSGQSIPMRYSRISEDRQSEGPVESTKPSYEMFSASQWNSPTPGTKTPKTASTSKQPEDTVTKKMLADALAALQQSSSKVGTEANNQQTIPLDCFRDLTHAMLDVMLQALQGPQAEHKEKMSVSTENPSTPTTGKSTPTSKASDQRSASESFVPEQPVHYSPPISKDNISDESKPPGCMDYFQDLLKIHEMCKKLQCANTDTVPACFSCHEAVPSCPVCPSKCQETTCAEVDPCKNNTVCAPKPEPCPSDPCSSNTYSPQVQQPDKTQSKCYIINNPFCPPMIQCAPCEANLSAAMPPVVLCTPPSSPQTLCVPYQFCPQQNMGQEMPQPKSNDTTESIPQKPTHSNCYAEAKNLCCQMLQSECCSFQIPNMHTCCTNTNSLHEPILSPSMPTAPPSLCIPPHCQAQQCINLMEVPPVQVAEPPAFKIQTTQVAELPNEDYSPMFIPVYVWKPLSSSPEIKPEVPAEKEMPQCCCCCHCCKQNDSPAINTNNSSGVPEQPAQTIIYSRNVSSQTSQQSIATSTQCKPHQVPTEPVVRTIIRESCYSPTCTFMKRTPYGLIPCTQAEELCQEEVMQMPTNQFCNTKQMAPKPLPQQWVPLTPETNACLQKCKEQEAQTCYSPMNFWQEYQNEPLHMPPLWSSINTSNMMSAAMAPVNYSQMAMDEMQTRMFSQPSYAKPPGMLLNDRVYQQRQVRPSQNEASQTDSPYFCKNVMEEQLAASQCIYPLEYSGAREEMPTDRLKQPQRESARPSEFCQFPQINTNNVSVTTSSVNIPEDPATPRFNLLGRFPFNNSEVMTFCPTPWTCSPLTMSLARMPNQNDSTMQSSQAQFTDTNVQTEPSLSPPPPQTFNEQQTSTTSVPTSVLNNSPVMLKTSPTSLKSSPTASRSSPISPKSSPTASRSSPISPKSSPVSLKTLPSSSLKSSIHQADQAIQTSSWQFINAQIQPGCPLSQIQKTSRHEDVAQQTQNTTAVETNCPLQTYSWQVLNVDVQTDTASLAGVATDVEVATGPSLATLVSVPHEPQCEKQKEIYRQRLPPCGALMQAKGAKVCTSPTQTS